MNSAPIICATFHRAMQICARNEACAGWKDQLLQCVVAGTWVCLGSLQAKDRTQ